LPKRLLKKHLRNEEMSMREIAVIILVCILIQGCAGYNVQVNKSKKFPPSQEMKIAVLPFISPIQQTVRKDLVLGENTQYPLENAGIHVADSVASALLQSPDILLIERSQLENILNEHKLSISGVINNPDFTLLGTILPVDALVLGNVSTCYRYVDKIGVWGSVVSYTARLVNIHSGEVIFSINCTSYKVGILPEELALLLAQDAIKKLLEK
jgi:curli biogenesis system outer membrane secretion channel CsgG